MEIAANHNLGLWKSALIIAILSMIMMNILETATQLFAKIVKNIMELRILIKNSKSKRDFDINLISKFKLILLILRNKKFII